MDQQNPNQSTEKHVPTEAEIARLEAEAVAALQRGEALPRREAPKAPVEAPEEAPAQPEAPQGFVPYVDDVPDPRPAAAETAGDDEDDDGEYIPSEMEKRIDAMTPEQWKRWQLLGGGAAGIAIVFCLFAFGQELSTYGLLVAALLAIFLPRYLERSWRRKLNVARLAMVVALAIGLIVMFVITGMRNGFHLKAQ